MNKIQDLFLNKGEINRNQKKLISPLFAKHLNKNILFKCLAHKGDMNRNREKNVNKIQETKKSWKAPRIYFNISYSDVSQIMVKSIETWKIMWKQSKIFFKMLYADVFQPKSLSTETNRNNVDTIKIFEKQILLGYVSILLGYVSILPGYVSILLDLGLCPNSSWLLTKFYLDLPFVWTL